MTWQNFKERVDAELAKLGKGPDIEIHHVDVWKPDGACMTIETTEENQLAVYEL